MMQVLHEEFAVRRVDCEGGGRVFRALLEAKLVDELHLTLCPLVFGGDAAPTLTGPPGDFLPRSVSCVLESMKVLEAECFLRYRIAY